MARYGICEERAVLFQSYAHRRAETETNRATY